MVKLNKIYTRTGDDGTTGLVDGSRVAKADVRMHAIGEVDEANSAIGVVIATLANGRSDEALADSTIGNLTRIQNDLFDLGADIATPAGEGDDFTPDEMTLRMMVQQSEWLEQTIDAANEDLEPLTSFILPGGSQAAAQTHLARATVRRAERAMVAAASQNAINPAAMTYINRLSDYLFVLGRLLNSGQGGDILWVPGQSR